MKIYLKREDMKKTAIQKENSPYYENKYINTNR